MYGPDAVWKLREAYAALVGRQPPDGMNAQQLAKDLFDAHDKVRLQEVYALLEEGLARHKEGKTEEAVQAFDKVLARQPLLDRRGEMVGAYVQYADTLAERDRASALTYLRKAQRLDPSGPRAQQIESAILYLEGMDLLGRGVADADTFRRAVALDPSNQKAQSQLSELEKKAEQRQTSVQRWAAAGAVFLLAVAGIILFGGRRKKPASA
jgi:tetratricopeptide (TPR) repeat protein